jgi:linker histone H1 and H5 family
MNEPPFIYNNSKINSSKIQNYINKNYLIKRKLSLEENIADFNFVENLLDHCGSVSKFVIDEIFNFGIFYAQLRITEVKDFGKEYEGLFGTDYYVIEPILVNKNSNDEYQITSLISKQNMLLYFTKVEQYLQIYKPLLSKHNILPLNVPLQKIMLITCYLDKNLEFSDIIGIIQKFLTDIYLNLIIGIAHDHAKYKPSFKYMLANAIKSGIEYNKKPSRQYIRKYISVNFKIDINVDENAKQAIKDLIFAPIGEPRIIPQKQSYFGSEELMNYVSNNLK